MSTWQDLFHPLTVEWFTARFGSPTEPQLAAWPSIAADQNTLVAAPTGSGKTLAAFLVCLDRLIRQCQVGQASSLPVQETSASLSGRVEAYPTLTDGIQVLYL